MPGQGGDGASWGGILGLAGCDFEDRPGLERCVPAQLLGNQKVKDKRRLRISDENAPNIEIWRNYMTYLAMA